MAELPPPLVSKTTRPKPPDPLPVKLAARIPPSTAPPPPPLRTTLPEPSAKMRPLKLKLPLMVSVPVTTRKPLPELFGPSVQLPSMKVKPLSAWLLAGQAVDVTDPLSQSTVVEAVGASETMEGQGVVALPTAVTPPVIVSVDMAV